MHNFYTNFFMRGDYLYLRHIKDGIPCLDKKKLTPSLFVESSTDSIHKTIHGKNLQQIKFNTPKEAKEFIYEASNMSVYGFPRYDYVEVNKLYPEEELEFDLRLVNVGYIDIETTVHITNKFPDSSRPLEQIISISYKLRKQNSIHLFGIGPASLLDTDRDVLYHECLDEKDLLNKFLQLYMTDYPDVLTGWNCESFDFPYLYARMKAVLGGSAAGKLSPWSIVDEQNVSNELRINIAGVTILDYLQLYKKFIFTRRKSYKLDYIAEFELNENKLHYDGTFEEFYTNDYDLFLSYNAHDTRLVYKLDEKLQLIDLACTLAYFAKCNYIDTFMNTRLWDVIVANTLANNNVHVLSNVKNARSTFEGAFVKETLPGFYKWAMSFDLTSLYPSILMQYNISPETILPESCFIRITPDDVLKRNAVFIKAQQNAKSLNATLCSNGALYSKEKRGIFPILTERLFDKRKQYKKEMQAWQKKEQTGVDAKSNIAKYNNLQMAAKILLNSLYGALGSPYFRHYNLWSAEGITHTGQVAIQTAQTQVNDYIIKITKNKRDYVIAGDTDSGYFDFSDVVATAFSVSTDVPVEKQVDFLDKVANGPVANTIADGYKVLAEDTNAFANWMDMKREAIGHGIFFGKKNYVMKVYDSEGVRYSEPKLKIVGHEAIESATPDFFEKRMTTMLDMMFTEDKQTLFSYEQAVRKEYMSMPVESVSKIQSISEIAKYESRMDNGEYPSGTPAHVKGTILYNTLLRERNLDNKYRLIKEGDKIKIATLKMPNPFGSNRIAFIDDFPDELRDVLKYLDKMSDYEKNFVDPMERSINVLGHSFHTKVTLEDLFG